MKNQGFQALIVKLSELLLMPTKHQLKKLLSHTLSN